MKTTLTDSLHESPSCNWKIRFDTLNTPIRCLLQRKTNNVSRTAERGASVRALVTELVLDSEELVVLGKPFGTAREHMFTALMDSVTLPI